MNRSLRALLLLTVAVAVLGGGGLAHAQESRPPNEGGITYSLSQPPKFKWYGGFGMGAYLEGSSHDFLGLLELRVFKDLTTPVAGLIGVAAEAYGGVRRDSLDGGVRVMLESPYFNVGGGADYNFRDNSVDALFSIMLPLRRGGLFGLGDLLRINWYPWKGHTFTLGFTFPLREPGAGNMRPRSDRVVVAEKRPDPIPYAVSDSAIERSLTRLRESALWISRYTTPFFDYDGKNHEQAMALSTAAIEELETQLAVRGFDDEVTRYHRELEHAFSLAAEGRALPDGTSTPLGREAATRAREIMLDQVIFPYNRLLGQKKKNDSLAELGIAARGLFARWELTVSGISPERTDAVLFVFQELLRIFDEVREFQRRAWTDARLAWIPLQFALLPEQHDTQAELDDIVERAVDNRFTNGNSVWYIANLEFQWELWRTIQEAEDYHVLWIHDFSGKNPAGDPDQIALAQVLGGYLAAMTQRAREYDSTGTFPTYLIFLDQHYYELKGGRFWMTFLEDPLHATLDFPDEFAWMGDSVSAYQEELRRAVAESELLQAEARQYGEEWLNNRIKVHVNITNQADRSFWSGRSLGMFFGYPDNIMRDHRKIAFYDITEDDPYKGMALYTGMGVGESYTGAEWEDRAIMAQGPAVLHLKYAARDLLLHQGVPPHLIPDPLRARPLAEPYQGVVRDSLRTMPWPARAMELHNETGYGSKDINVFKATLYSLAPPGTLLKIPDSLWNSPFFASLLVGACLRGANVLIVSPSLANAPSAGPPQMSRAYELYARLIVLQEVLGDEIAAAGGMLKTGLYDLEVDVRDTPGRVRVMVRGLRANPWLRELLPFDDATLEAFLQAAEGVEAFGAPIDVADSGFVRPKLHGKMQFFAGEAGWQSVLGRPEWAELALASVPLVAKRRLEESGQYVDVREVPEELNVILVRLASGYLAGLSPEERERQFQFLIVGSQNQDYRGMFMDGEVGFVVSGTEALAALLDFVFIVASATWVDDIEALNEVLPPFTEFQRRVGRMLKEAL